MPAGMYVLAKRFSAAIYVSDRRWNIRMAGRQDDPIEVKLPEDKPETAWKKLSDLQEKEEVVTKIDRFVFRDVHPIQRYLALTLIALLLAEARKSSSET